MLPRSTRVVRGSPFAKNRQDLAEHRLDERNYAEEFVKVTAFDRTVRDMTSTGIEQQVFLHRSLPSPAGGSVATGPPAGEGGYGRSTHGDLECAVVG